MDNTVDVVFSPPQNSVEYGFSVSHAGDVNGDGYSDVIVGARVGTGTFTYSGVAYLYFGGSTMDNVFDLKMEGQSYLSYFGVSVSSAGDVNNDGFSDIIIGSMGNNTNAGNAYIYLGGYAMDNIADVTFSGEAANDEFGNSVSGAGDVNGDGYDDVIVGAYQNSSAASIAGRAYIFYGGSSMNNTADKTFNGLTSADYFGQSVSGGGDLNGDGYDDVIVGAYQNDAGGAEAGSAYIFYGGTNMNTNADNIFLGNSGNLLGNSVSLIGDFNNDGYDDIVVGAYVNDEGGIDAGKAYVFTNTANTNHIAMQTFTGSYPVQNLGYSVSNAGDVNGDGYSDIIVGSSNLNDAFIYFGGEFMDNVADVTMTGSQSYFIIAAGAGDVNNDGYDDVIVADPYVNAGTASIFYGGPNMNNTVDVSLSGQNNNDLFGYSISSAGDVNNDGYDDVIIGAPYAGAGKAYIYFGGSSMNNIADVTMTGSAGGDRFGFSVSKSGKLNLDNFDDVIVGAPTNDDGGIDAGRAYIFYGAASMDNISDLIFTGVNQGFLLGNSVASAGDVNGDSYNDVLVSAPFGENTKGRAYIYFGGTVLDNIADVTLAGENETYLYGNSLSSLGDINKDGFADVIIGEPQNNGQGNLAGRAYIYYGGAVMNNIADRIIYGEVSGDQFGYSVSSAGDVDKDGINEFMISAPSNDQAGANFGTVYLFKSTETGTDITDNAFSGAAAGDEYGYSVNFAGDVNGDGFDDVIIGALYNDNAGTNRGRAYIYYGGLIMEYIPDVYLDGAAPNDHFGTSVAYAGDVNQDGKADVIVGAPDNDAGGTDAGRAYIYFGGTNMNNVADVILTGQTAGDRFGFCVSSARYLNGDGAADVIVGAPFNDAGGVNAGRAYIYFGGVAMNNAADVIITGAAAGYWLGMSCAYAGNVNGDFYDDVVVGATMHDAAGTNTGKAYIFFGSPGMDNIADVTLSGEAASDQFGYSVSFAGNVNGDSYTDVIVGAYSNDAGGIDAGRAYIYLGGSLMDNTVDVVLTGASQFDFFGVSVAGAANLNSDAYEDVIVGACLNDAGGPDAGRAYVYYGGSAMNNDPDVLLTGKNPYDNFGWSVSYAGDFNSDGLADLITGANFNDQAGTSSGKAYLFINSHPVDQIILTLKIIEQGFYNPGPDDLSISDTMKVSLHNQNFPYNQIDITKDVINKITFNGRFFFHNAPAGNYYIRVRHRNCIETWSAVPVNFNKNTNVNYDFTSSVAKAFGSNMVQVDNTPARFAIYSGDQDQDGNVDATDILTIFNDMNNFVEGYVKTDITGDYFVDSTDLLLAFNNSNNNVSVIAP